jgi:hypothetical protein
MGVKKITACDFHTSSFPPLQLINSGTTIHSIYRTKIGQSVFSARTESQYIERIFTVARCGSANQDFSMVHALRCSTTLPSCSSGTHELCVSRAVGRIR